MTADTLPARVCVESVERCGGRSVVRSQSHDGVPVAPRGRGRRPRRAASATTTNYILGLDSSSTGRENNLNLRLAAGWSA